MTGRVKQRFVEEGFDVCLGRKPSIKVKDKKRMGKMLRSDVKARYA